MSDKKKTMPKYETPTVVALGELARGIGTCGSGSSPDDSCGSGAVASTSCGSGIAAGSSCGVGSTPGT